MPEDSAPSTKYLRPASVDRSVVAVDGGDDVERQRLQLEAEIERDQVVGRDHHHHAERGEQRSAPDTRSARSSRARAKLERHDDGERRADQRQHLHEAGEGVDDEGAVERWRRLRRPAMTTATTGSQQDERRRARRPTASTRSPREDADHQQRQRADGEDQLRQDGQSAGSRSAIIASPATASPARVAAPRADAPPDSCWMSLSTDAAVTSMIGAG